MTSYPVEIRRCRHIKTNGTQCGSPALKGEEFCFYHKENRPRAAEIYLEGDRYSDGQIMIPVLEDAHSIQMVIQQVVRLMMSRRIDRKDAGLMLYALQIASGNLKMMQAEKAKPTQVVVEPEKAGETPLGMTPWSASGQGHDPEEEGEEEGEPEPAPPAPPPTARERYRGLSVEERLEMREKFRSKGLFTEQEYEEWLTEDGHDPVLLVLERLERKRQARAENSGAPGGDGLAAGSIQACAGVGH